MAACTMIDYNCCDMCNPVPTSDNALIESMRQTFDECIGLAIAKNHDYAGGGVNDDPFKNFRRAPDLAGVSVERAILVRVSDKLCRLSNILDGPVAVGDERVEDTLKDTINYLGILKAWIEERHD